MSDRNWLVLSILIGLLCLALGVVLWRGSGDRMELSDGETSVVGARPADESITTARREPGAQLEENRAETSRVAETIAIEGTISAVDENGEPVIVEDGRLEYEIFDRDGPSRRPAARVENGRFAIDLGPDDHLFMTGKLRFGRGYVCEDWDEAWIERRDLLAEGLHLKTEIGARRRIKVVDAKNGEELEGIEIHTAWPWFVTEADGRRVRPGPLATEDSPLDLRPGCGTSRHLVLTRPGYAPRRLGDAETEFKLDPAGRLEVRVAADWPKIDRRNRLRLRITPQESSASWRSAVWPDLDLRGPRHALLVFERVPTGSCGVALLGGAAGILEQHAIEIRAGAVARVDFGAGLAGLEHAPTHLRGRIRGWPGRPFESHRSFSLQLGRGDDTTWRSAAISGRAESSRPSPRETIDFEFDKILPGRLRLDFLGHVLPVDLPPEGIEDFRIDFENLPLVEVAFHDEAGRLLGPDEITATQDPFGPLHFSGARGAFLAVSRRDAIRYQVLDADGERSGPFRWIRERELSESRRIDRIIGPAVSVDLVLGTAEPRLLEAFKYVARGDMKQRLIHAETIAGDSVAVVAIELQGEVLRIWLADPGHYRIAVDPRYGYRGEAEFEVHRGADGAATRVAFEVDAATPEMRRLLGLEVEEN